MNSLTEILKCILPLIALSLYGYLTYSLVIGILTPQIKKGLKMARKIDLSKIFNKANKAICKMLKN